MFRVKSFVKERRSVLALASGLALAWTGSSFAQGAAAPAEAPKEPAQMVIDGPSPTSPEELLEQVRKGWAVEKQEDKDREARFSSAREDQQRLLSEAKALEASKEGLSQSLEADYQAKEVKITELTQVLESRMGNLGELFGVTRQVAGDTRGNIEASITSSQFGPGRIEFLNKLGASKELPSVGELQGLWEELVREMVEQGKVVQYKTKVSTPSGVEEREVVRAGPFTVISNGEYLLWDAAQQQLKVLGRQPPSKFVDTIDEYADSDEEYAGLAVDPSRGSLLAVLIETRTLVERIPEGGGVGYAIMVLAAFAAVVGAIKFVTIIVTARKVSSQKKNPNRPDKSNPLGRVLSVAKENPDVDREKLELLLDEAVLRETSKLESWIWLVKVVSVVGPLMGLLGTVTGMIKTFQAITLFGAGDPRMMAGGISEALVTTMQGLVTAIPMVLLHSALTYNTKQIVDTLDEQSAGLIAQQD
ncbi:MotA/TolQ/ExbB proton channel family protein [Myxococcota bacterium]|nr:MotA/TolQ/ExbB proton channel family protein [Myxococcota bacterium]